MESDEISWDLGKVYFSLRKVDLEMKLMRFPKLSQPEFPEGYKFL